MDKISVLLVEDHAIVRQKYRELLQQDRNIDVIAEADNGERAFDLCLALAPAMVVMDLSLPGMNGLQAMQRILDTRPSSRILIFSMHEEAVYVRQALKNGARGYVTKAYAPDVLPVAVREIARGRSYFSPDVARFLPSVTGGGAIGL